MTTINDDNLVVLVQEAFHCRLGGPGDIASEAGPVTGPPEGITLAVLLSEDQQDLLRKQPQGETALGGYYVARFKRNLQLWKNFLQSGRHASSGVMSSLKHKNYSIDEINKQVRY